MHTCSVEDVLQRHTYTSENTQMTNNQKACKHMVKRMSTTQKQGKKQTLLLIEYTLCNNYSSMNIIKKCIEIKKHLPTFHTSHSYSFHNVEKLDKTNTINTNKNI